MVDPYKIMIGRRIKDRRRKLGITQEVLAEKLDISVKHLSDVERGVKGLSIENLVFVGEFLGMDMNYLILGDAESDDVIINRLKFLYLRISPDKRHYALEAFEAISKLSVS